MKSIKLKGGRNTTSTDLWYRKGGLHNTTVIKRPTNRTPLRLSKGNDNSDMANLYRPSFLRSNPKPYVPDFDVLDEQNQQQRGQTVHLSDETIRTLSGANKTVLKLEKMLDNPATLTPEGFKKLVDKIKKLDYPDRIILNDSISKSGTTIAAQVLEAINEIAPPAIRAQAPTGSITDDDLELKYVEDDRDTFLKELKSAVKRKVRALQEKKMGEDNLDALISNLDSGDEKESTNTRTPAQKKGDQLGS